MKKIITFLVLTIVGTASHQAYAADFSLVSNIPVASVEEGNSVVVQLTLSRDDLADPVDLVLVGGPSVFENATITLSDTQLSGADTTTDLIFDLEIGVAPILAHQRRVIVRATAGSITHDLVVPINVTPVQAPDIYVLAGQSNMLGINLNQPGRDPSVGGLDEPNPRILQLSRGIDSGFYNPGADGDFILAQDPLQDITGGLDSVGPGLTFAKNLLHTTTQDIVLVPVAETNTGLFQLNAEWNSGNPTTPGDGGASYESAITRTNYTIDETGGVLRGVLWVQGEGDTTTCTGNYNNYMTEFPEFFAGFKNDLQVDLKGDYTDLPIVVGTMSPDWILNNPCRQEVDRAHRTLTSGTVPTARLAMFGDLAAPLYPPDGDIHFGKLAAREMGRRFAKVFNFFK